MTDIQNQLDEILERFDKKSEPFSEASILDAIGQLRRASDRTIEEPHIPLQAESMAFGFTENYQNDRAGWGTYYGPMAVMKDENGQWFESPSIKLVTQEIIRYWQERTTTATHPILRCRYADLIWDFTKPILGENPDVSFARIVIVETLIIVEKSLCKYKGHMITKLARALSLALSIKDKTKVEVVRDTMIAFEDRIAQDDLCGLWGFSFDYLIENKKVPFTQEQERKIIEDLEARLKRTSSNEEGCTLRPHASEAAAMRLARYYYKGNKVEDARRVLRLYGKAYVMESEKSGGLAGLSWLQKVFEVFYANGMKEDANALTERIRELGKQSNEEMQAISVETTITREEMEQFVSDMAKGTFNECLSRITGYFISDPEEIEEQVKELAINAPLQYLITGTIQDKEGRTVAQIGPLEEDLEGHVAMQTSRNMEFSAVFLRMVLEKIAENYDPLLQRIMDYIYQSPVYDPEYRPIIENGMAAYLRGDHAAAIHILIPMIENTLRRLMVLTGGPVYRPDQRGGLSLRSLDKILQDEGVIRSLGESTVHYLRVLLTDQRGWNLRNNICHGLQHPNTFGYKVGDRLLHVLLVLAQLREKRTIAPEEAKSD